MSQGRGEEFDEVGHGSQDAIPMPPIQGVARVAQEPLHVPFPGVSGDGEDGGTDLDPWGAEEVVEEAAAPLEMEIPEEVEAPRRGGGVFTIPLLCLGIAIIACVTLLPLADENHRFAWEREKLKADLAQLVEQTRVNDEFLQRVADDPVLAERLAQRQMKYIREGSSVLPLRGSQKEEMSPFMLLNVPAPVAQPPYQPMGGALAMLVRDPRTQLYSCGGALLLIATGLVLGHVPKGKSGEDVD